MEVKIYTDYETLSDTVANAIVDLIKEKPTAVICFASGHTPLRTCQLFVQKIKEQKMDVSQVHFIGLDEWVEVEPDNEGSCHYFLYNTIFIPLEIAASQIHVFDAMSNDIEQECKKMDTIIESKGGIDLMIVGIGMNGHIGFNEPGVSFANYSHVINLDETTLTVGQKYFSTATNISKGITLGLQHLMESKKAILIANAERKAEIIKKTIEEKITNQIPATIMQQHNNGFIFLDEAAATLLKMISK
jgi:galactosamine-6-phosphate isomerase